jgi:hypothetical protein
MEEWKLQVSYKTPAGDMINVRANTADELSVLLEGVGDYSTQVAAVQRLVVGAYNAAHTSTKRSHTIRDSEPDVHTRSENLPTGSEQSEWEALRFLGMPNPTGDSRPVQASKLNRR